MSLTLPTPSLSISLALTPPTYNPSTSRSPPTLSIHTTLLTPHPITLLTWHSILHPRQALTQSRFIITSKPDSASVPQVVKKNKRPAIQRRRGGPDEKLFVTLLPGVEYVAQTPFGPEGEGAGMLEAVEHGGRVHGVRGLGKGEYSLGVSEEGGEIGWWRYGTVEENLEPEDGADYALGDSAEPVPLRIDAGGIKAVDFVVE